MKKSNSSPEKLDRKTVEKNRRMIMKGLCSKLISLVPPHHFKPSKELSQQAQLDQVALYIKQLKERVEELKVKRSLAMGDKIGTNTNNIRDTTDGSYLGFPVVFELRDLGSSLEVTFISGLKKNFVLNEVISVLQDEGADVVSVHFSTIGDKVFHTLHAQVKVSRVGVETSRVYQRLQQLLC
ncbi:Transcription factor bHLH36 like [Actinidia chinensis var. chinensis]|uniref:Transcription factor bHLH36 like n=1 Tax=Actinidia chinensis var. chinensis TaxID=1590841 RepID=A0A2R6PS34_ACTCC|nr:Transcription factor bHLH36 like [Actinidia chinensis var. chinensis]